MKAIHLLILITFPLLLQVHLHSQTGTLENFASKVGADEEDSNRSAKQSNDRSRHGRDSEPWYGSLFDGMFDNFFDLDHDRDVGYPILPGMELDLMYQNVESDIYALDGRAELGFGLLGLQYRDTYYKEEVPDESMNIRQLHGFLRLSDGKIFELDLGLGGLSVDKASAAYGFSATTPFQMHFQPGLGVEFRPAWSKLNGKWIRDYDLRFVYTYEYFSAKVGYRWLEASGVELDGVQFGASIHF
jgi:hypothetical protein